VAAATLISDGLRDAVDVRFASGPAHVRQRAPRGVRSRVAARGRADSTAGRDVVSSPGGALVARDLHVVYPGGGHAVRGVDLTVGDCECVALVGESGCGKTTIARAALGILPAGTDVQGSLHVGQIDAARRSDAELRQVRGVRAGYVAQDPYMAYDPLQAVRRHVTEAWRAHGLAAPNGEAARRVGSLGVEHAAERLRQRPFQWSGGMLQRASIVAANAHQPILTIADEPTSALDARLAGEVLTDLRRASRSVLLITHDLLLVTARSDRVAVMYAGRVVEHGPTAQVIGHARHPYTKALLAASPRLGGQLPEVLPGAHPSLSDPVASGCAFAPRCPVRQPICATKDPPTIAGVACWVVNGP
jgi:peptide/nickel transport system ATP-binding protein